MLLPCIPERHTSFRKVTFIMLDKLTAMRISSLDYMSDTEFYIWHSIYADEFKVSINVTSSVKKADDAINSMRTVIDTND